MNPGRKKQCNLVDENARINESRHRNNAIIYLKKNSNKIV